MNFSNILDINFTFVFLPCKCARLLIMTKYNLFRGIYIYLGNVKFYQFFRVVLLLIHFGSGAARIRNDFFPDPAKNFVFDRIRIHNTANNVRNKNTFLY